MKIVIAGARPWTVTKAREFCQRHGELDVTIVEQPAALKYDLLRSISPEYIFPHWSWRIPSSIYSNFCCVVFHPSDLPFGRSAVNFPFPGLRRSYGPSRGAGAAWPTWVTQRRLS